MSLVVIIWLGVGLIEQTDAGLDERARLGFEIQGREFLDRSADGAVGPGDDVITDISVIQNVRRKALKPRTVKILAVQGQAGDHAGLVKARAIVEASRGIDPRDFGRDDAVGNGDGGRAGQQGADRCAGGRRRLDRLSPHRLSQGDDESCARDSGNPFHAVAYLESPGP